MMRAQKKKRGVLKRVLFFVLVVGLLIFSAMKPVFLMKEVVVKKGDTMSRFYQELPWFDQIFVKAYQKVSGVTMKSLQPGLYQFSGLYSKVAFFNAINQGPQKSYQRFTVLEGWSIYDVQKSLSDKKFADTDEYLKFVTDEKIIQKYSDRFEFLALASAEKKLSSLEGFLYPDTYNIDVSQDFVDQLVYLQLSSFDTKIWQPFSSQINYFSRYLQERGYTVDLDFYQLLTLASVIEKEERNKTNKPVIASVFLNRLKQNMRLDADITLCYGLQKPYEVCTPAFIAEGIYDEKNPYNTRQQSGLPPTPISSVSEQTFSALMNFESSDYFYYLHDSKGQIYFGKTYEDHNLNKSKYLNN
ncbi:MAG TPA: endolytic transglycosylase MltG [Candidatus Absconditabacterales bacterium]|nr:endolytic transglycosylase MltG [Candidatus Absconditabacterales bacterium]